MPLNALTLFIRCYYSWLPSIKLYLKIAAIQLSSIDTFRQRHILLSKTFTAFLLKQVHKLTRSIIPKPAKHFSEFVQPTKTSQLNHSDQSKARSSESVSKTCLNLSRKHFCLGVAFPKIFGLTETWQGTCQHRIPEIFSDAGELFVFEAQASGKCF